MEALRDPQSPFKNLNPFFVLEFSVQIAKHLLTPSVPPCLRVPRVRRRRLHTFSTRPAAQNTEGREARGHGEIKDRRCRL